MNWQEHFKKFPVQAALAALLVYFATLATGVTVSSLTLTAKVAGWDYQPLAGQPLFWLLTLPLRLLPGTLVPLGLNVFGAICGAATLFFLAATLQLVAWDRPLTTLPGWRARLPLLLGVGLCGLEFSFWQAATQNNGESLQILLLAAAIWCLFRYRVTESSRWLKIACVIWGAGMAENWAMILMFPFFLVALFWMGRERLLNRSLLIRLGLFGLAGFSILILPPIVNALTPGSPWGWVESFRESFNAFKSPLKVVYAVFWRSGKLAMLAVTIFYLLPMLPMLIRQPDTGTRNIAALDRYQIWGIRALRGAVLLLLAWLALNPAVGLREILREKFSLALPLLSLDYLVALAAAILCGNLLLSLSQPRQPGYEDDYRRSRPAPALPAIACATLVIVIFGSLVWRNLAAITLPNRQAFSNFGANVLAHLPEKNGVLLSDDTLRMFSLCAAGGGTSHRWPVINTEWLARPGYYHQLTNACPDVRFVSPGTNPTPVVNMAATLATLTQSNSVFYLHHSFGPWFERYYLRPAGLGQRLVPYADRSISPPGLTATQVQETEKFWDSATPLLIALKASSAPDAKRVFGFAAPLCRKLHLKPHVPVQSKLLSEWYAAALDDWGVQLQRADHLTAAQKRFEQALTLNERNSSAQINRLCNSNLLASRALNLAWYPALTAELGDPKKLARFLKLHGPVDEPAFCYLLARHSTRAGMPRQALQLLLRADALAPNTPATKIELAGLYAQCGFEAEARETIRAVREKLPASFMQTNAMLDVSLSLLEAGTWLQSSNAAQSKEILQSVLDERPDDTQTALLILKAHLASGDFSSALELTEAQIKKYPADNGWQLQKALILDRIGKPAIALAQLESLLARTNFPPALLLRSKIFMSTGERDKSEADLQQLLKDNNLGSFARLGLAEISLHRQDTNAALEHLRLGAEGAPPNSPYAQLLKQKISELKPNESSAR